MTDIETTTDDVESQTPDQLLVDLAELHIRTLVSPLPKHPAAMGWQATAGAMAAGFARALHALNEAAPDKAGEITDWFQGPFGDGPDPEEHTDWTEQVIAKSPAVLEQWVTEAQELARGAKEATEAREQAEAVEPGADIHTHFGLSYANYLVLPRTLLQSMPKDWQQPFVALLEQLHSGFDHVPQAPAYEVTAGEEMLLEDMTGSQLYAAGIEIEGEDPGEGPTGKTSYHRVKDGRELSGQDYGFVPGVDPVPHYNRGRTRVEPRLDGAK
ncbi:hypothetical protein AB0D12_31965 [Streptomyces sp. NPDC048479]|uniref:hypothetical protein n=1 Tax=Streptomyces sp. NPDC048479 TaxID=3154725 RepID=UPI0034303CA4